MKSCIHLIRHGITEGNQKQWYYGEADLPLAPEGLEQIAGLAAAGLYPKVPEGDFYTTGLTRTEQTFKLIYGDTPHKQIVDLHEMNFGDYECKSYEELKSVPGFTAWVEDQTGDIAFPGGESKSGFAARISRGLHELLGYHRLRELAHRHSGKDAVSVLVCHGGVMSQIMQELFPAENKNMWDWIPDPGHGYTVNFVDSDPVSYEKI